MKCGEIFNEVRGAIKGNIYTRRFNCQARFPIYKEWYPGIDWSDGILYYGIETITAYGEAAPVKEKGMFGVSLVTVRTHNEGFVRGKCVIQRHAFSKMPGLVCEDEAMRHLMEIEYRLENGGLVSKPLSPCEGRMADFRHFSKFMRPETYEELRTRRPEPAMR